MATLRLIGVNSANRQTEFQVDLPSTLNGSILSGVTSAADTIPLSTLISVKYEITVWTSLKTQTMTLAVSYDSSGIRDTVFGISGSRILMSINSIVVGSDMKLDITNSEAETLNYKIDKK